ncbi:MAG TPA: hypothetical protein VF857_06910, partial [Spirochaetota bacterium]
MSIKKKSVKQGDLKPDQSDVEQSFLLEKEENDDLLQKKFSGKKLLFRLLRIVLVWVPLFLIGCIITILIAADLFLSPARVEKLAVENFNQMSNGTLSLNVRAFSPYSNIIIENIVIKNLKEFGDTNLLEIKRLVFRYGFFSMLVGQVHFDEIGIYKPRLYLIQKKGVWNIEK